jgi:hypothetical protein
MQVSNHIYIYIYIYIYINSCSAHGCLLIYIYIYIYNIHSCSAHGRVLFDGVFERLPFWEVCLRTTMHIYIYTYIHVCMYTCMQYIGVRISTFIYFGVKERNFYCFLFLCVGTVCLAAVTLQPRGVLCCSPGEGCVAAQGSAVLQPRGVLVHSSQQDIAYFVFTRRCCYVQRVYSDNMGFMQHLDRGIGSRCVSYRHEKKRLPSVCVIEMCFLEARKE